MPHVRIAPRWAVLGAIGLCLGATVSSAADDGLVGHWKFDEAQGFFAEDSSGSDNDADLWGAQWVRGGFGTALSFSGVNSYVSVPRVEGLDGSDELSVEAWVYWEGGGQYPNILTGGRWSPGGFLVFVSNERCSFRMGRPGHAASDAGGGWEEIGAPLVAKIEFGRWYHLAATFKRPDITTYVDGEKVGSAKWDYPVGYAGDILIGRWSSTQQCHQGLIDEVEIYNRALTAEEVQASYAAEAPRRGSPEAGAKAYEIIPEAEQRGEALVKLETEFFTFEVDERGKCLALVDKRTGEDRITRAMPLASVRIGDRTIRRTRCSYQDGKLTIEFGKSEVRAVISVTARQRYLVFEVLSVEWADVDELTFLTLELPPGKYRNRMSGLVAGEEFGVCVRALNLDTQVTLGGSPPTLRAIGSKKYGLAGAKAALVACPTRELRTVLQEMVQTEGVPQSSLGGPWALDAEDCRGSYLFARVSESDVDRWIDLALRGGFTHVHFSGWGKSLGHYEPSERLFPNGLEGMKMCVRKIHNAGLKAGMHTLTGCIATNDPWVTPVPDARLAADATYALAADMDEQSDTILTVEKPGKHDVIWAYASRGNVIRIGEELIHYAAISYEEPYGFLNCTRGAFGTTVSAHEKGATADHLRSVYRAFYPDEDSTLVGDVADCIARVYNECEMDQIYMDGAEGMGGWHRVAVMRDAIYAKLERPALVEASCWGHWSWYYHSRVGAWDHPKWGMKQFHDMHCEQIPYYRKGGLLQAQLGWWVVLGPSGFNRPEMPDEMEYFCAKTLANEVPMSVQGIGALGRPANARMPEYLTIAGRYERLRLASYFTEAVKERLREPGAEFRLHQADDGEWEFVPTDYPEHRVTGLANGANAWTVSNRFGRQPLKLRIEALHAAYPYDSEDALLIADFGDIAEFTVHTNASGVTHTLERSTEQVKVGEVSACFSATSTRDAREGGWAKAGRRFSPHLSMQQCDAVGVWIHGDGKGELLNIQLSNPREYQHAYAEHYVTVDFEGWRYFELLLREQDAARYRDYQWPYYSQHGVFRTRLTRDHVSELNLYFNDLPPGDTATVYLSPLKALRTTTVELRNPTLQVNGQKLTVPVTLQSGSYLELEPTGECAVYDRRCALLERVQVEGELPVLNAGENEVTFTCEGSEGFAARANVMFVTEGPVFRGRRPDGEIAWEALRYEYELPRVVTALDGRQNQWDVICRADAPSAQLGIELEVQQIGATGEAYNDPAALTIESFDDLSFFADSPDNEFAKYVYDGEHKGIANKPGVTHEFEPSTEVVKVGESGARYTASSTRDDNIGWSARGRHFRDPLDLSAFRGLGFWLHGDARGESFKMQLRDDAGGWQDMVTRVDFSGWRYIEFDLGSPKLNLAKVEYMIMYYNGLPGGQTVTCYVDDVRALPETQGIERPELTVGGRRIVFPVELSVGDRLVFKGVEDFRLYRKLGGEPERMRPEGTPPVLRPGLNPVTFALGPNSPEQFRIAVSLVKEYQ